MSFLRNLLGKDRPQTEPAEFTFKQRIEGMWSWYSEVADRFYQTIENGNCGFLSDEVSEAVDRHLPGMAWVFGPGEEPGGHSFTLSGEGIEFKQVLALHWLKRAPRIDKWTFHAERQPSEVPGHFSLKVDDLEFKAMEFWVTPEIDEEYEQVDITVWHPLVDEVGTRHCQMVLFLMLDEIFGEMGTGRWIGKMEFSQKKLGESMPILELKEFVETARDTRGWKLLHPCDTWTGYKIPPEKRSEKARLDTIAGGTTCWKSFRKFLSDPDSFVDPFREFGAAWVYLSLPTSVLPKGKQVDAREEMAEVIAEALAAEHSGILLGGAIGGERSYIDFLIFDGARSEQIIRGVARKAGLPADTRLEFLDAKERHRGGPVFV
ncbi:MAG TPA: hypothetical protein VGE67_05085 [Haloferula sp.]